MTLRLADLEAPLDDVEFPDGSVHRPRPFGPTEYKLWRDVQTETDAEKRGTALLQIMRGCYPTATDENFETCTVRMVWAMIGHAARNIEMVKTALKNGAAVAAAENPPQAETTTPPSSPKTNGDTSSRRSRKRSVNAGGEPTPASHTEGQSSSGSPTTTLKNPDESTPYAVSWKTSTAPASPASS